MLVTLQGDKPHDIIKNPDNPSIDVSSFLLTSKEKEKSNEPEKKYYYLEENIERLTQPIFMSQNIYIKFSQFMLQREFENYFYNYDKHFEVANQKQIFASSCKELIQKFPQFSALNIEWLVISKSHADISHIFVKCKIQLLAKSLLTALFSIFIPQDLSKTECAVKLHANSKAIFKNCHFYNAEGDAVIVQNYSSVVFENCIFDNNKISCVIMDGSYAKFIDCKFKNDRNISIFVTKNSQCEIFNCLFSNNPGKAIFAKDDSNIYITQTRFINCQKGAVTITNNSSLFLNNQIIIQNPQNTAIRAVNNCHIKALDVIIENANGNAINMEKTDGYFVNCTMKGTIHPTIVVNGRKSNPIFHNCKIIDNKDTFCVISKNCCRPLFDNCYFSNCKTNCFSVSDFSRPHIQNCLFNDIEKYFIYSFSGSFPTYDNLTTTETINILNKISSSPTAKCEQKNIEEDSLDNDDDDLNEEEEEEEADNCCTVKPWRSPTYDILPEITVMEDPEIISKGNLKPLEKVKLSKIFKKFNKKEPDFICSECHKRMDINDEIYVKYPCGHLLCTECRRLSKCSICDAPINEIQRIYHEEYCLSCSERKPNTISYPCGHLCLCYKCATKCFCCPMYCEPLKYYKYIFNDTYVADSQTNENNDK